MTAHPTAQFTPGQILEAARRAESERRYDFALQLYRHLAAQHPDAPEAATAQEGIARLLPPTSGQRAYFPQSPAPSLAPPGGLPGRAPTRRAVSIAPLDRAGEWPAFVAPRPCRDYRVGRMLARMLAWIGGIVALAGLGAVPLAIFVPEAMLVLPPGWRLLGGVVLGSGLACGGLVLVVLGQLARALLEQANATRDLAAMTRARAEHEAARPTR